MPNDHIVNIEYSIERIEENVKALVDEQKLGPCTLYELLDDVRKLKERVKQLHSVFTND